MDIKIPLVFPNKIISVSQYKCIRNKGREHTAINPYLIHFLFLKHM